MKILVTGGAGFIGSHLIHRLTTDGHDVVCVDVVNDYYDPELKEARIKRFPETVKLYRVDVTDRQSLQKIYEDEQFDVVCHLAAQAGVRYSLEHPDVYVNTNYVGTFNILELSKIHNIKHTLIASTSSVYGTSKNMPFRESEPTGTPMSVYAATKIGTEFLGSSYNHLFNLNVSFFRFFTVYGPWGRPDMALFKFTKSILEEKPIDVYNNGEMKRDFTYVDDIVEGFTLAIDKPNGFQVYNLGNGRPVHLMEFIRTIEEELGQKAEINFMPLQAGDVPETFADTKKAEQVLGFHAKTSVQEGVHNFTTWYKSYYGV